MKNILSGFLMVISISTIILSCSNNPENNSTEDIKTAIKSTTEQDELSFEAGQDYKLAWSDEFETDSIDENNWNFQVEEAGRFNNEWQRYTNSHENAFIEDGCLVIKAIHEDDEHALGNYTSARMNTANKQTWKYGKIVARAKLPFSNGIWPAFWMLSANIDENGGDTPWPQAGEIDIFEMYGSKNEALVEANIHYADASGSHASMGAAPFKLKEGRFADAFHVFELDWDETRLTWLVDGIEYASISITAEMSEFHKDFFILFNVAVGGTWAGYPDAESVFPQSMYVDWVRVYQKK